MATSPKIQRSLSQIPSQILNTISSITSLLQTLNPQYPNYPFNPNPSILNQFSQHLNPYFVIRVIKNQQNPYHALFFFNWVSNPNPNNYSHSHFTYIAITDVLLGRKLFSLATDLLECNDKLSDFMVGKLIKAHGDLGHIRWAIRLFERVKVRYSGRCLFSYNAILGVLVRGDRVDLAEKLFYEMIGEGVVNPDVGTCTVMIKGFCKTGRIEDARKVFDEMGGKRNLRSFNTLVSGMCKKGLMDEALEIVERMKGSEDCLPDIVTYTTLIDGYCKIGDLDEAKKCFDEMVSRNVEPNEVTYNALTNGLCVCGDIDGAKRMMTKMRLNGFKDTITTHTNLLRGYCIVGRSDEAFKHFKDLISRGMKPDTKSYEVLVNEFCKLRKPDEAIDLLRDMSEQGIRPRVCSFNKVFKVLVELEQPDRAVILFNQMPQMGCRANFLSYNAVICGLITAKGRMKVVEGLVKDMVTNGFEPDATMYGYLLEGYWVDGNEEMVRRISQELVDKGFLTNIHFLSHLKRTYMHAARFLRLRIILR
uniref:Pentatricopeptide repeat-containing protein At4g11690-like n=1 Tax=Tanacetum cinerariifolium TaxID=118510 RepID=A0A6L2KUC6_TANCI|nr:pentatricopeptide repeat-containing protein At4g11690-like [Tanacetum cinerariifolium]